VGCVVEHNTEPVVLAPPEPSAHLRLGEQVVRNDFINTVRFKQIGNASFDCYIGRAFNQFLPVVFAVNLSRFLWRG
jgi:hypothetical protein